MSTMFMNATDKAGVISTLWKAHARSREKGKPAADSTNPVSNAMVFDVLKLCIRKLYLNRHCIHHIFVFQLSSMITPPSGVLILRFSQRDIRRPFAVDCHSRGVC